MINADNIKTLAKLRADADALKISMTADAHSDSQTISADN